MFNFHVEGKDSLAKCSNLSFAALKIIKENFPTVI